MLAGIYKHYKGGYYQVLGVAAHSETGEEVVVYVSLDGIHLPGPRMRVRPRKMFEEDVLEPAHHLQDNAAVVPRFVRRFEYVGTEVLKP